MRYDKARYLLYFALTVLSLSGFLAAKIYFDPSIHYLIRNPNASWILLPEKFNLYLNHYQTSVTAFRTTVDIEKKIIKPELNIRAFKSGKLFINGKLAQRFDKKETDWKKTNTFVFDRIEPGKYEILIAVSNHSGPPALLVYSEDLNVFSDKNWEARSPENGTWLPVRLAEERTILQLSQKFLPAHQALFQTLPYALVLSLLYLCAVYLTKRFRIHVGANHLRWILVSLFIILSINSVLKTKPAGFDYVFHIDYIEFIAKHLRLPLASDGPQMFQAPLYHLSSALVFKPLLPLQKAQQPLNFLIVIPLLCGLAMVEICYRTSLYTFPDRPDLQKLCTLTGAFFPMNLYMTQYLGNEPLAAVFTALAILLTVAMMNNPKLAGSWKHLFYLGASIGLALLSRATPVLIIAPIFVSYAIVQHSNRIPWKSILKNLAGVGLIIIAFCGWYYVRNWIVAGKPFVGGWDPSRGILWWQDPGYRTAGDFFTFGYSLIHPIYAASAGFWDGLYSTMWLDGFLGGNPSFKLRPPWNYDFMLSNAWLSILPTVGLVVGMVHSVVGKKKEKNRVMLFAAACIGVYFAAIFYLYLVLPIYSTVKATYTLGLLPCYAVVCTAGLAVLMRKVWLSHLITMSMFIWAAYSYIAYFPT